MDTTQVTNELSWTIDALKGEYGWALCFTTWRAILSFTFGFINDKIQSYVESLIPEDQKFLNEKVFGKRWYRMTGKLLKVLTTIKLPNEGTKSSGNTNPPFPKTTTADSGTTPPPPTS